MWPGRDSSGLTGAGTCPSRRLQRESQELPQMLFCCPSIVADIGASRTLVHSAFRYTRKPDFSATLLYSFIALRLPGLKVFAPRVAADKRWRHIQPSPSPPRPTALPPPPS